MKRVTDYRSNAQACRELAAKMPKAQRRQLLDMAAMWDQLADEREQGLKNENATPVRPKSLD